jgi:hypothetical protein
MSVPLTLTEVEPFTPSIQYVAVSGQTVFPYPFPITQDADLVVYINGVQQNTDVGYTLSGQGNATGGTLTFTNGQSGGSVITMVRNLSIQRVTQFPQNGVFSSAAINAEYNKIYLLLQQMQNRLNRTLQLPDTNFPAPVTTFVPSTYANSYLSFDAFGNPTPTLLTSSGPITLPIISALTGAQTTAEQAAGIAPLFQQYQEGDIRRYGAVTTNNDNSVAVNQALLVSAAGGAAAYIPGGIFPTTLPVIVPAASSIYGMGTASGIRPSNGIDGLQFNAADAGIIARSRFIANFQIIGTLSGTPLTNNAAGVRINLPVVGSPPTQTVISHTQFSNLSILNFQWGMNIQGLDYSKIEGCFIQNCYHGIYFNNQSINVAVIANTVQLTGSPRITSIDASNSRGISVQGSPEVEALQIIGNSIYGFAYDIALGLIFECHIISNDISNATVCPIFISSTIGGLNIESNWIELGPSAAGTWDAPGNDANLTGIFCPPVSSVDAKIIIRGNYIIADAALTGSTGLYLGDQNAGLIVRDNQIKNFDVGIGGGGVSGGVFTNIGGLLVGGYIVGNTINANTDAIRINTLSTVELDNYIVAGNLLVPNAGMPAHMIYRQVNAPMQGKAQFIASTTCVVTFDNPLPVGMVPRPILSGNNAGFCSTSGESNTGFTINCSVSNSNTTNWQI